MNEIDLSRHASIRARQRGVTYGQIDAVVMHADERRHRGRGTVAVWVSRRKLEELGARTPEGVDTDRLHGIVVLLKERVCITIVRDSEARMYRRRS